MLVLLRILRSPIVLVGSGGLLVPGRPLHPGLGRQAARILAEAVIDLVDVGLSPAEALATATSVAARTCGLGSARVGCGRTTTPTCGYFDQERPVRVLIGSDPTRRMPGMR